MIRRDPSDIDWEKMEIENVYIDETEVYGEKRIPQQHGQTTIYKKPSNRTYLVKCSSDKIFEFSEGTTSKNKKQVDTFIVLWLRTGGFRISDEETMVPAQVAALGKPSVAAYLDVTQRIDRKKIADLLFISKGTVEQYVSKVRREHR